jgi:hypothetical protein
MVVILVGGHFNSIMVPQYLFSNQHREKLDLDQLPDKFTLVFSPTLGGLLAPAHC